MDLPADLLPAAPLWAGNLVYLLLMVAAVSTGEPVEAGALIAEGAKAIKGGGGRGADLAQAGGKDPGGLDQALDLARQAAGIAG